MSASRTKEQQRYNWSYYQNNTVREGVKNIRKIFFTIFFYMKIVGLQDSNWNILRNLIDENHFLRKYKERTRQWRQVAGHKDSFVEGQNQGKTPYLSLTSF